MGKEKKKPSILFFSEGFVISSDALLEAEQAAAILGMKPAAFYKYNPQIVARHGLQRVLCGKRYKYRLQSLQDVIKHCAETEEPLYVSGNNEIFANLRGPEEADEQ